MVGRAGLEPTPVDFQSTALPVKLPTRIMTALKTAPVQVLASFKLAVKVLFIKAVHFNPFTTASLFLLRIHPKLPVHYRTYGNALPFSFVAPFLVGLKGVEPLRSEAREPKSRMSSNSIIAPDSCFLREQTIF